jgi:hypothetical protein
MRTLITIGLAQILASRRIARAARYVRFYEDGAVTASRDAEDRWKRAKSPHRLVSARGRRLFFLA